MANKGKKKSADAGSNIAENRRARHDYFIENTMAAGLVLQGWEVKSLRAGRANLAEAYVMLRDGEVWLTGAHFSPMLSASTHVEADPVFDAGKRIERLDLRDDASTAGWREVSEFNERRAADRLGDIGKYLSHRGCPPLEKARARCRGPCASGSWGSQGEQHRSAVVRAQAQARQRR